MAIAIESDVVVIVSMTNNKLLISARMLDQHSYDKVSFLSVYTPTRFFFFFFQKSE